MQWLLTTLQTIITFALVFTVLVFFHELGHFLAAKWLKMVVEEFAFGLPIPGTKRLCRFAFDGQTEYTVWPVLAGGFVRIKGMEIEDVPATAGNPSQPLLWHEAMDSTVEKMTGRASENPSSVPSAPLPIGATENAQTATATVARPQTDTDPQETEGFPTTTGRLLEQEAAEVSGADPDGFNSRPIRHRFAVIFAGPLFSFLFGWLVFCSIGMLIGFPTTGRLAIGDMQKDSIAAKSGLQNGDTILSINGSVLEAEDALKTIKTSVDKPLTFSVRGLDGATRTVTATPKASQLPGETKPVGRLGFTPDLQTLTSKRIGPVESFKVGTQMTGDWFSLMGNIVKSGRVKESLGGPVAIFKETRRVSQRGAYQTALMLAQLSLSLGLFNLFPIPVLDGGHLLLMGVEFVRRKKLTAEQTARVLTGGFIFLALMTVIILVKDIFGL